MSDNVFKLECHFEGRVQGVGFRYQTVSVAKGFEVSGTVRNLLDGRVYLCAEGEEAEVQAFATEVESELKAYIKKVETESSQGPRSHKGFTISH